MMVLQMSESPGCLMHTLKVRFGAYLNHSSLLYLSFCRLNSRTHTTRTEACHGVPSQRRLVRDEGLSLEGLPRPHVGPQPTIQEGACHQASSIAKRVRRNLRRLSGSS